MAKRIPPRVRSGQGVLSGMATCRARWRAGFERRDDRRMRELEEKISAREARLTHKEEGIAEIMELHVRVRRVLGRFRGVVDGP